MELDDLGAAGVRDTDPFVFAPPNEVTLPPAGVKVTEPLLPDPLGVDVTGDPLEIWAETAGIRPKSHERDAPSSTQAAGYRSTSRGVDGLVHAAMRSQYYSYVVYARPDMRYKSPIDVDALRGPGRGGNPGLTFSIDTRRREPPGPHLSDDD